jgi:hypothetical protein
MLMSSIAKFRLDRALAMFESLGGERAREVAERYLTDPGTERFEEFIAVCLPLYHTTPQDPDVLARTIRRDEVGFHFFRGEAFTYDWLDELRASAALSRSSPASSIRSRRWPTTRTCAIGFPDHASRSSKVPVTAYSATERARR